MCAILYQWRCYQWKKILLSFPEEKWLSSFALTLDVGELDAHFIEKNRKKFSSLERSGNNKYVPIFCCFEYWVCKVMVAEIIICVFAMVLSLDFN